MLTVLSITRKMVRHVIIENKVPPDLLPQISIKSLNGFYAWACAMYPTAFFITCHVDKAGVDHVDIGYFRDVEVKNKEEEPDENRKD